MNADHPSKGVKIACRLTAKPLKQSVLVPIDPALDDFAVLETIDRDAGPSDLFIGRCKIHVFARSGNSRSAL